MNFLQQTGRMLDWAIVCFTWFSGILMIFALFSVCVDVVLRYFFNSPTGWVLQISEYILLYIPFLSAAYVLKEEGHIKVDILLGLLSQRIQALFETVTSILGAGILLVLTYYGAYVSYDYYVRNVITLKFLKIPEFWVILVIPAGCLLFALQFIRRANRCFLKYRSESAGKTGYQSCVSSHE